MPDTIRLGVIGTGLAVEKLHWPALTALGERFKVTAFADVDRDHAEHFADYAGASMDAWSADYHELLGRDDVDAILISLPIPLAGTALQDALASGKHVICEKPPAATEDEARALFPVIANYPDQVLLIAENYYYRDDVRLAKQIAESGDLGRIHLMNFRRIRQLIPRPGEFSSTPWRWQGNYTGGPHLDGGVHQTAMIRMVLGDVERLSAETQDANPTHGGPSDLSVNMRFVSDAIGNLTLGSVELAMPEDGHDLRVYGTEAVMSVGDKKVTVYRPDKTETYSFASQDGGYIGEFQNFYEAVTLGAPVIGDFYQSYRAMEIITKGVASSTDGRSITLDNEFGVRTIAPLPMWLPHGETELSVKYTARTGKGTA